MASPSLKSRVMIFRRFNRSFLGKVYGMKAQKYGVKIEKSESFSDNRRYFITFRMIYEKAGYIPGRFLWLYNRNPLCILIF